MRRRLTFSLDRVRDLVAETESAAGHLPYFGFKGPHLWLVGDHGLYLMSNRAGRPEGDRASVAYARECDPVAMGFDDWWEAKRRYWGGDDGVHPIPLDWVNHALARAEPGHTLLALDFRGWRSWLNGGLRTV